MHSHLWDDVALGKFPLCCLQEPSCSVLKDTPSGRSNWDIHVTCPPKLDPNETMSSRVPACQSPLRAERCSGSLSVLSQGLFPIGQMDLLVT